MPIFFLAHKIILHKKDAGDSDFEDFDQKDFEVMKSIQTVFTWIEKYNV